LILSGETTAGVVSVEKRKGARVDAAGKTDTLIAGSAFESKKSGVGAV